MPVNRRPTKTSMNATVNDAVEANRTSDMPDPGRILPRLASQASPTPAGFPERCRPSQKTRNSAGNTASVAIAQFRRTTSELRRYPQKYRLSIKAFVLECACLPCFECKVCAQMITQIAFMGERLLEFSIIDVAIDKGVVELEIGSPNVYLRQVAADEFGSCKTTILYASAAKVAVDEYAVPELDVDQLAVFEADVGEGAVFKCNLP